MMRYLSLSALLLLTSCALLTGKSPPTREGVYEITGRELTPAQEQNVRDRVAAAYQCARELGHRPTRHIREMRILPGCRGGSLYFPVAYVDYCTHAAQHEAVGAAFGHDSTHPKNSVVIQCEHAGPKSFECSCPETGAR